MVRLRPRNVKEKKEHNPRVTHVQVRGQCAAKPAPPARRKLGAMCRCAGGLTRTTGWCAGNWCLVCARTPQEDEEHVHIEDEEKGTAKSFRANQAFDGGCSQRQMFDLCGIKGLLDSAIEGFPVCAFAYGQTGSGKTHTIIGEEAFITRKGACGGGTSPAHARAVVTRLCASGGGYDTCGAGYRGSEVDGLIPRAGQYLFERMAAMTDRTFKLRATFLEIYNEQVYDLLNYDSHKPRPLYVRHSPKVGFFVEDLSEMEPLYMHPRTSFHQVGGKRWRQSAY